MTAQVLQALAESFIRDVLGAYTDLLGIGLPIVLFIGASNVAINIIVSAFFGGRLVIGGHKQ